MSRPVSSIPVCLSVCFTTRTLGLGALRGRVMPQLICVLNTAATFDVLHCDLIYPADTLLTQHFLQRRQIVFFQDVGDFGEETSHADLWLTLEGWSLTVVGGGGGGRAVGWLSLIVVVDSPVWGDIFTADFFTVGVRSIVVLASVEWGSEGRVSLVVRIIHVYS